jgi:type VII secretion protein EccB
MSSRRDQLHAYQFMMQRVTSALIVHETDPEQTPLRRGVGAIFAGVMIAVLVAAGFGVYGVFTGVGGTSWQADGSIVIERETGATFVYQGGELQPVLNYASARLLSSGQNPGPHRVAGKDLAGIPRKPTVGIAGAPESLPAADRVAGTPWTLCSVPGQDSGGTATMTTTLLVGRDVPGGTVPGQRGILVRDPVADADYLVWRDHRYRITGDSVIRSVFGTQGSIVDSGAAWLNGLPAGQDIGPIAVTGRGAKSSVLAGREVGDIVYYPVRGGEQYYLVRSDGLLPVTEFQVRVLRGQYVVEPVEVSASVVNSAQIVGGTPTGDTAPPAETPELVAVAEGGAVLCARTTDARSAPQVSVGGDTAVLAGGIQTTGETSAGTALADRVLVPPGEIAVVRVAPSDEDGVAGAFALVTDMGLRFPVSSTEALSRLGYSEANAVSVPAALVSRIPEGPTLDPVAAGQAALA